MLSKDTSSQGATQGDASRTRNGTLTKKHFVAIALTLAITFTLFTQTILHRSPSDEIVRFGGFPAHSVTRDTSSDVHNETLGFQKVFAINLPKRSDKRDSMAMQARLTNFSIEFHDGVQGSAVSPKSIPYTMDQADNVVGHWRAHLDLLSKIVRENIQTALIFEDNADWDVSFKSQLEQFARGSRWLLGAEEKSSTSPYGQGWDVLHFGHCHSESRASDGRRWVIPNDPTVPPADVRHSFAQPNMDRWEKGDTPDAQARIVYMQQFGYCSSAYAISRLAAQRVLYQASLVPFDMSIDVGIGKLCDGSEFSDFSCVAPFPRLVGTVKKLGNDDAAMEGTNDMVHKSSVSEHVMFSVRHNIERILRKESTFKSFLPNPYGDELTLEQITSAQGHPEYVDV